MATVYAATVHTCIIEKSVRCDGLCSIEFAIDTPCAGTEKKTARDFWWAVGEFCFEGTWHFWCNVAFSSFPFQNGRQFEKKKCHLFIFFFIAPSFVFEMHIITCLLF